MILKNHKKNVSKSKENKDKDDNKKENVNENEETKENNNKNDKKSKIKEKENKSKGKGSSKKDVKNISKYSNKKKNKTISKEKNQKITNIHINNIKNVHYININNIKTNFLTKTCEYNNKINNKINLYKKITEATKTQREGSNSNSNSKTKGSKKLNTINCNKIKQEQFKNYINFQNLKKNMTKKIKKEITNKFKNNKTMNTDLIQKIKDFGLNINNNIINKNNSLAMDKNALKKGIFLSKNKNNNNKFVMNYKLKFKKTKNVNNELNNQKSYNNNVKKISVKDSDNYVNIKNLKIKRLSKMGQLFNNVRTSRACQKRYFINSVSNSQSKSKSISKTGGTRTSSSNSRSTSIRDRIKKECLIVFKSSRNNYTKSKSGIKNIKQNINLTQEQLKNLKSFKQIKMKGKEKYKLFEYNANLISKISNVRGSTFSKSKKKISSKPKNNNNIYNKIQNFKTSKDKKKLKKKIKKSNNYMNILINDISYNNIIQRYNTNIVEKKIINENKSNSNKSQNTINFGLIKRDNSKINKDESNSIQKLKKSEKNLKDNNIFMNKQKNIQKLKVNKVKRPIKDKLSFHQINNYNKLKEYNKYSIFNNTSNIIQDEKSQDYNFDYSNIKLSSKNKNNQLINSSKNNKSNHNNKLSKKIKIGVLKSLKIKGIQSYQDTKPQTYRKEKKILEEYLFNNDVKNKDNNNIYSSVNFTNNNKK
jgi:hypothetical protein